MKLSWFSCDVSRELAWVAQALHPGAIQHMDQVIITLKDIELWSSTSEDHTLLNLAVLPMKCVISPVSRVLSALCQELQRRDYSANEATALACQLSSPEDGYCTLLHQAVTWICRSIPPLTGVTHQECQPVLPHKQGIMSPYAGIQHASQTVITWTYFILQLKYVLTPLQQSSSSSNPALSPPAPDILKPQSKDVSFLSQTYAFSSLQRVIGTIQSLRHTVLAYNQDVVSAHISIQLPCQASMSLNLTLVKHILKPLGQLSWIKPFEVMPPIKRIPSPSQDTPSSHLDSVTFSYTVMVRNVFQSLFQSASTQNHNIITSTKSSVQPQNQPMSLLNIRAKLRQSLSYHTHFKVVPAIENSHLPRQDKLRPRTTIVPLSFLVVARHALQTLLQQSFSSKRFYESVQSIEHIQSRDHDLQTVRHNDVPLSYRKTAKHAFQSLLQSITWQDKDVVSPKLSIQQTQQKISSLDHIPIPLVRVLQPLYSTFASRNPFVVSPGANIAQAAPQDEPIPMYIKVLRNAIQSLRNTVSPYNVDPGSSSLNIQSAPSPSRYAMLLDYACQPLTQAVSPYSNDAASAKTAIQPTSVSALGHAITPLKSILQSLQGTLSPNSKSISPSPNVQEDPLNDHAMSLSYIYLSMKNVFQPLCQALASRIPTMEPSYASRAQPVIQHVSPAPCPTLWNQVIQLIGQVFSPYTRNPMSLNHGSLEINQTNPKSICDNIPKNHTPYLIHRTCSNLKDATESLARYVRQARLPYTLFTMPVRGALQRFTSDVLTENIVVKPLKSCIQSVRQAVVASSSAVVQMSSDLLVFKDVLLKLRHAYKPVCRSISLSRHVVLPFSRTLLPLRRALLPIHHIILELRHAILPLIDAITPLCKTALIVFHSLAPFRLALPYLSHTMLPVIHVTALLSKAVPAPVLLRTIQLLERIDAQLKRVAIPLITTSIRLSCNTIVTFIDRLVKPGSQVVTSLIHAVMSWRDRYSALLIPVLLKLKHNIQPSDHTLHKLNELVQQMKTGRIVLLNKVDKILHNAPLPPQYVTQLYSHSAKRLRDIFLPTKHVIFCLNETALSLSKVIFELRHTIVPTIRAMPPMLDAIPPLVEVIPPASQAILPLGELIFPLGCGVCVLGHTLLPMISSLLPVATSSYEILSALPTTFMFAFLDKGASLCGMLW